MSARNGERPRWETALLVLYVLTVFGVLGASVAFYSTTLNPGLPLILGGALAALWALVRLALGAGPFYNSASDLGLLLGLWMTAGTLLSLDSYLSQRTLATYFGALAIMWATQIAVRSIEGWLLVARVFVGLVCLVCLFAWPQVIAEVRATGTMPALRGTFANQDTFAVLPMLALCLGVGLLEAGGRFWRFLLGAQLLILVASLLATGCRSAVLGFGVGLGVFFVLLLVRHRSKVAGSPVLIALPVLFLLFILPFTNLGIPSLSRWQASLTADPSETEATRWEVATQGWRAVAARPLMGAGPGAFGLAFQAVRPYGHDHLYVNIAHNDPVQMAVETGIPGLILWLFLFYAAATRAYTCAKAGRRPIEAASALAAVLAPFVYSFFNFIIEERPVLWAQFFVLGLALSFPSSRRVHKETGVARYVGPIFLLAGAVWTVSVGWTTLRTDSLVVEANWYRQRLQFEEADKKLAAAVALQPNRYVLWLMRAELASALSEFTGLGGEKVEDFIQGARKASPANTSVLMRLAAHQMAEENWSGAEASLRSAMALAPGDHQVGEQLTACLVRAGSFAAAADLLFQRSDYEKKDFKSQIVSLLAAAEGRKSGEGVEQLKAWMGGPRGDDALALLEVFVQDSGQRGNWDLQARLLRLQLEKDPTNLCQRTALAEAEGHVKGAAYEYSQLEALRKKTTDYDNPCAERLMKRWSTVGAGQGKTAVIIPALQQLVKDKPTRTWTRLELSRLLEQEQRHDEAIKLLREGLSNNPYSFDLLKRTGQLYDASGNTDLAVNYYQDAIRVKDDSVLRARVAELMKGN